MILKYILFISITQVILYMITYRMKLKYVPIIIFSILLICYFLILPKHLYPELVPEGINSGMPILGINLAFWIFGGGAASIIHIRYCMIKRIIILEKQSKTLY